MDNQLNNHEKEFKKALEGISFDINTSDVWLDIKDRLPLEQKKEKRPFWLFFSLGLGLVMLSSFAMYTYLVDDVRDTVVDTIAFRNVTPIVDSSSSDNHNSKISNATISDSKYDAKSNKNAIVAIKENNKSQIIYSKNNKRSPLNLLSNTLYNSTKNISSSYTDIDHQITYSNGINENSSDKNQGLAAEISKVSRTKLSPLSSLDQLSGRLMIELDAPSINLDFDQGINPISNLNTKKITFFGSIRTGANYGIATNNLIDLSSEFDVSKFDNESSRIGVSNEIVIGSETAKGWRLYGGISLTNEVYNYSRQDIENSEIEEIGTQSNHIAAQGVTTEVSGPVTINRTTTYNQNWHRRHQRIAASIGVAKRISLLERLSLMPEVSLQYDINQKSSGYYFSKENADIEYFTSNESNPYAVNNSIKYRAGVGVDYDLGNVSIGILASYVYNPNNYLQESIFYKSKSDLIGLQFSVSYYPNW